LLLAAPAGFVVGFGGHESEQLVQVVAGGGEDGVVVLGADSEHEPFAVGVEQLQAPQRCRCLGGDDDLAGRFGEGELPAAQIEG